MMDKEWFGRSSWGKRLVFLSLGILAGCQTTPNLGQRHEVPRSQADLASVQESLGGPVAQVSSSELPNGGLGWVTVTVPVRSDGLAASVTEVSAQLVGSPQSGESSQPEENVKTDEVKLLFFESELTEVDTKSRGSRIFQAFLPIPYSRLPGPARVLVTIRDHGDQAQIEVPFQVVEGKYSSEKLRVNPSRVHPRKADLPRIARELKEVGAVYRNFDRKKFWKGSFELPIRSEVTSEFGTRRVYNGALKGFHSGLDLRAPVGTPIYSAAPGRVALAKDLFFTGNTVILDHGYGVMTLYAHMSELKVKVGDLVSLKQLVGLSGQTGRVNGPHLHWQAVIDGVKVNPVGLTQDRVP